MRVLLVNQTFYPDVAATAQHAHDLGRHLTRRGHSVVVVTSRSLYGASGAALPRRETVDGIEVHRVGFSLFGKGGTWARAIDFGLFYVAAAWRVLTIPRVDVVVPFTTPPLIAGVGWLAKRLRGVPFVYWVMDLYPDLAVASGMMKPGGAVAGVFERVSRGCLGEAARVVVLGRCMRARIEAKGIEPGKIAHIGVWADKDEVKGEGAEGCEGGGERETTRERNPKRAAWGLSGLSGGLAVMYSGNLGLGHDIGAICGAMERLRDREDVRFVFVGGGKRMGEVKAFAEARGLTNARFEPYQPREELSDALTAGDVHLISQKVELTGMLVPCKLFGVLAAARPVLFIGSADAEVGRIVGEERCGFVVPEGDGEGLAAAIERLAADPAEREAMGRRGRAALEAKYDRALACEAWERLLGEVVAEAAGRAQPARAGVE